MGMPAGCTAGPNITAKQRLSCIGNGWDLNVVKMFWDHYRLELLSRSRPRSSLASVPCSGDLSSDQQLQQCAIMGMLSQMPSVDFAAMLSNHSLSRQQDMLGLIKHWYGAHPVLMACANTSVLDSGSSRHLQSGAIVLDADNTVSIEGFDGSIKWTAGNGYLPIAVSNQVDGSSCNLDIADCDRMQGLSQAIMSLGKLLRLGWEFHFTMLGKDCHAVSPDGYTKVKVELGRDDILRLPHTIRHGADAAMLPDLPGHGNKGSLPLPAKQRACVVSRHVDGATAAFLHDLFLHCSEDRCYYTLLHTVGYKAVRLPKHECTTCAQSNARRHGLRHKPVPAVPPAPCLVNTEAAGDLDYEDVDDDEYCDSDMSDNDDGLLYRAPAAGRQLGTAAPRFDITSLRPFEVVMVDNKGYDCAQRGGDKIAFIAICVKTRAKFKVDVTRKDQNGWAWSTIASSNGTG